MTITHIAIRGLTGTLISVASEIQRHWRISGMSEGGREADTRTLGIGYADNVRRAAIDSLQSRDVNA